MIRFISSNEDKPRTSNECYQELNRKVDKVKRAALHSYKELDSLFKEKDNHLFRIWKNVFQQYFLSPTKKILTKLRLYREDKLHPGTIENFLFSINNLVSEYNEQTMYTLDVMGSQLDRIETYINTTAESIKQNVQSYDPKIKTNIISDFALLLSLCEKLKVFPVEMDLQYCVFACVLA